MKTNEILAYENPGFDGELYIKKQKEAIKERIGHFDHRLYLEIGGKFLHDPHAARVLPGFKVDSKKQIFQSLVAQSDVIFCINAKDIHVNRQLNSFTSSYIDEISSMLIQIKNELDIQPFIAINRVTEENLEEVKLVQVYLQELGYKSFLRYEIEDYPTNLEKVFGDVGYIKDEYIPVTKDLVLVTGAASGSGKMSTCLGQIYHEHNKNLDSGYAKYETFPIWNLPLNHPVNLAYEAATADIGDYNMIDPYYKKAYSKESVNYNRDIEAFEIVMKLGSMFLPENNYTRSYKSPTDMGINMAGFCITDEKIVTNAAIDEIYRRKNWYEEIYNRGEGSKGTIDKCEKILEKLG